MYGPRSTHEVPCSFCGIGVRCICLTPRDHRRWCEACEDRYVVPSQHAPEPRRPGEPRSEPPRPEGQDPR